MYHNLLAAQGFLELVDPDSAWEDLETISGEGGAHPIVWRLRVHFYRQKKRWVMWPR